MTQLVVTRAHLFRQIVGQLVTGVTKMVLWHPVVPHRVLLHPSEILHIRDVVDKLVKGGRDCPNVGLLVSCLILVGRVLVEYAHYHALDVPT